MANKNGNPNNLIKRSSKESQKNKIDGRKGGIKSGIVRRQKRDTFEWLEMLEKSNIPKEDAEDLRKKFNELKGEEYISQNAVIAFYTMKEAREPNNIPARRLYYDTKFKLMALKRVSQQNVEEAQLKENDLKDALAKSLGDTKNVFEQ